MSHGDRSYQFLYLHVKLGDVENAATAAATSPSATTGQRDEIWPNVRRLGYFKKATSLSSKFVSSLL